MSGNDSRDWWRDAVIYQIYPRSFADAGGDGVGDIAGVRRRLPHLTELGVDAIWLSPWYASPMADAGYDVADYRAIAPHFGDLADAEGLIADAHRAGLRLIVDIVPNHASREHAWFRAALAEGPRSPLRQRFWFRPGRGDDGGEPPNDWRSIFGGPAWSRTKNPDGTPGEWYLHLFAPEQPDFNWNHPAVREEFDAVLRFWFDRGADGIRIDSAALLVKHPDLPDSADPEPLYTDRDEVHDVYRRWRAIADGYDPARVLIGEVWLPDSRRFARYLRPDELHTAFNFDFLCCPWDAARLREVIDATLDAHAPVGATPTWVLSNHDVTRHVTRYGRADTSFSFADRREGVPTDRELGTRRARAAILLALALPGSAYVYQGEELGLWEVEDIPASLRDDPMWHRSGHTDPGRDGCRVPLPWNGTAPPFGFGPSGSVPWLPQPDAWRAHTAETERRQPGSMLRLYQAALATRRDTWARADTAPAWRPSPPGVLSFSRKPGLTCLANLSRDPIPLPPRQRILLASTDPVGDLLPADATVWLKAD
jgi:alpha-glucosidase